MSLSGFLLARIAEDEARWAKVGGDYNAPHDPDCDYPGDMPGICTCNLLDRLRAECEAKRRIVARCQWVEDHPEWGNDMELAANWEDARATLLDLALPYADYPDFREEWRP